MYSIRDFLKKEEVDAILINSPENKYYLADFYSSSGYIFITKHFKYILVDSRYYQEIINKELDFELILINSYQSFINSIKKICKNDKVRSIGVEGNYISFDEYMSLKKQLNYKIKSINLCELRKIKKGYEIEHIKKACEVADETLNYIIENIKEGMTEKSVENMMINYIRSHDDCKEAFDIIVASGKRGAMPHAKATNKVINRGDFVTIDFGVRYKYYNSDITRTLCIGESDRKLSSIYDIVRRANEETIKKIKHGISIKEIDSIARKIITDAGYEKYFNHNLGHGLGIKVHEYPDISSLSEDTIEENMIITIEPGIYIPNLGGVRIEDDILVTLEGAICLSKTGKDLLII